MHAFLCDDRTHDASDTAFWDEEEPQHVFGSTVQGKATKTFEAKQPGTQRKGREVRWNDLANDEKETYQKALGVEWEKWSKHARVTIIPPEKAKHIRKDLIIGSRYVLTDKNDQKRTPDKPLPVAAKARMVVWGHLESELGKFRRDSPTGTCNGQTLMAETGASEKWPIESADADHAYFQGEDLDR